MRQQAGLPHLDRSANTAHRLHAARRNAACRLKQRFRAKAVRAGRYPPLFPNTAILAGPYAQPALVAGQDGPGTKGVRQGLNRLLQHLPAGAAGLRADAGRLAGGRQGLHRKAIVMRQESARRCFLKTTAGLRAGSDQAASGHATGRLGHHPLGEHMGAGRPHGRDTEKQGQQADRRPQPCSPGSLALPHWHFPCSDALYEGILRLVGLAVNCPATRAGNCPDGGDFAILDTRSIPF